MFARLEFVHNGSRCAMTGVDYGAIEIVRIEKIEGVTTDRRILFILTESVWPSSAIPSYFRIWREEKWPFSTIQTTTTTSESRYQR